MRQPAAARRTLQRASGALVACRRSARRLCDALSSTGPGLVARLPVRGTRPPGDDLADREPGRRAPVTAHRVRRRRRPADPDCRRRRGALARLGHAAREPRGGVRGSRGLGAHRDRCAPGGRVAARAAGFSAPILRLRGITGPDLARDRCRRERSGRQRPRDLVPGRVATGRRFAPRGAGRATLEPRRPRPATPACRSAASDWPGRDCSACAATSGRRFAWFRMATARDG